MKKKVIAYSVLFVFYVLVALSTYEFVYLFANVLGSTIMGHPFQGIGQIYPLLSASIAPLMFLFFFHFYYSRKTIEARNLSLIIFGLIQMALSCAALIYSFVYILNGTYESQILGYPTLLFPIDAVIYHIIIMFVGCYMYLYALRQKSYYRKDFPLRELTSKARRGSFATLGTFGLLISTYSFGALLMSMGFGEVYPSNTNMVVAISILLLMPSLNYAYYWALEGFSKLKERRNFLIGSFTIAGLDLVSLVYFYISFGLDTTSYIEVSQAYFPWTYMAGVGIAMILLNSTLIGCLIYFPYRALTHKGFATK